MSLSMGRAGPVLAWIRQLVMLENGLSMPVAHLINIPASLSCSSSNPHCREEAKITDIRDLTLACTAGFDLEVLAWVFSSRLF